MRIDESSPLIYVLMIACAAVLIGVVLAIYWPELAVLMRALAST